MRRLDVNYIPQPQRSRPQHNTHQGKSQCQLIADHLRARAQSAQQRIFVIRRPTRQRNSVNANPRNSKDDQEADIHIGNLKQVDTSDLNLPAERNDGNRNQRATQRNHRRQNIKRPIDARRQQVFLQK